MLAPAPCSAYIIGMTTPPITELTTRARDVFRLVVDAYLETGQPVGSRTLSKLAALNLSPASIRNVMQDLEELGLLASPHTSAGRMPTDTRAAPVRRRDDAGRRTERGGPGTNRGKPH